MMRNEQPVESDLTDGQITVKLKASFNQAVKAVLDARKKIPRNY